MQLKIKTFQIILLTIFLAGKSVALGQQFKLAATLNDIHSPVTCLAMSTDGRFLISGDEEGTIHFRDAESGTLLSSIKTFNRPVDKMNFNSTGKLMVVSSRDGEIKIYDFVQQKFIQSLYSPEYSEMHFALFSIADGFIYFNGQGRLYKTRSDLTQQVKLIAEFDSVITNAVVTDDRSALIFSSGNTIRVLNTRTDQVTQELTVSSSKIERLALFSENRLASWSSDGTIVFRKYELNQLSSEMLLWFKAGTCSNLSFSHDGSMMVTGNVATWARIWKPFEHTVLQELFGHKEVVNNFVFSPDDQTLFTSSIDRTIKVWKQKITELKPIVSKPDSISKTTVVTREKIPDSSSVTSQVVPSNDPLLPAIELDQFGTPSNLGGRKIDQTTVVEVDSPELDIYVFDNSTLDGDIMSLSFHNQWILNHYEVSKKKKKITLQLEAGTNNYLVLFADNLGKTPPNTAAISFTQNKQERIFRLTSDLKSCSSINFLYKKRN